MLERSLRISDWAGTLALFTGLLLLSSLASGAEAPAFIEIGGKVYGAKADDRGPIGGGKGYRGGLEKGDFTAKTLDELIDALAAAKAGQVVFLPGNAEIDLTARIYVEGLVLELPGGVTLAGDRGLKGSRGALLTSDALKTPVMIKALGPNARVTGIRLQGPNPKRYLDHHSRSFGRGRKGRGYYYKFPTSDGIVTDQPGLTVDNCEISAFSHAGVFLKKGTGHEIHHNHIHHCQYNGLGYGVCHDTASSLIECNLFDFNRHSIAGTGRPGCSYTARNNVELGTSLSHCFDMHGGRDRKDGTDIAGTVIIIENNTFRASRTPVVIRGTPEKTCTVRRNWFPRHQAPGRAVRAGKNTRVKDNAYGPSPEEAR